ncbi:MAG: type II secretion system protein [Clostridiales bacterium]|nr:type II secretion system protein [Clostridiales bacterium]
MKIVHKTKRGFTLVEMVLVIAIIVILAAVLLIGVAGYLNRARNAAASLSLHNQEVREITDNINSEI